MSRQSYTFNTGLTTPVRSIRNLSVSSERERKDRFAFGYFFDKRAGKSFRDLVEEYAPFLREVYFPWPGLLSAREIKGDVEKQRKSIIDDMRFCRSKGLDLDMLMNATCYGDKSFTAAQKDDYFANLKLLGQAGIMPEIITTTSPYIATITKTFSKDIDRRASVNMRLNSTLAMEYVADSFDSYYICRDIQRDLQTLRSFAAWAQHNGKKLCMLANSGCLRYCPWQTFHETLLSHDFIHIFKEMKAVQMKPTLCTDIISQKKYEEILRCSWIRPEDIHMYMPFVSVVKLSTREADRPDLILKAYTSGSFDGNLLDLLDPTFSGFTHPLILDNKAFPKEWSEGKIAGQCANNCTHCGKCTEVLAAILKRDPLLPDYTKYSLAKPRKPDKIPSC